MKHLSFITLSVALLLASCSQVEEPRTTESTSDCDMGTSDGLRSRGEAIQFAISKLNNLDQDSNHSLRSRASMSVDVDTYNYGVSTNAIDSTTVYVLNFGNDEGFALVSANPDVQDLLAFSDTGRFETENDQSGLDDFILSAASNYGVQPVPKDSFIYNPFEPVPLPGSPAWYATVIHGDHECHLVPDSVTYGSRTLHLTQTEWGQVNPYNTHVTRYVENGEFAGCVPVAIGQIMTYHRKPSVFEGQTLDWDLILTSPNPMFFSDPGGYEISWLLYRIGQTIGASYEGKKGTGVLPGKEVPYFRSLGFNCSNLVTYSFSSVVSEIRNNRPVYVRADDRNGPDGHAWIIDGYYYTDYTNTYYHVKTLTLCGTQTVRRVEYVHCNWGWKGDANGYYLSGLFQVETDKGDGDYTSNIQMLTDLY